jgi:hypothetical protein
VVLAALLAESVAVPVVPVPYAALESVLVVVVLIALVESVVLAFLLVQAVIAPAASASTRPRANFPLIMLVHPP